MPQNPPTRRLRLDRDRKLIRFVFSRAVDSFEVGPGEAFALADALVKLAETLEPKKVLRGCRLPADWGPDTALLVWAAKERPDVHIPPTVAAFKDFWDSKPGKDGLKLDWNKTFRNWVRNTKRGDAPKQQPPRVDLEVPDISGCTRCHGARMWYPDGYGKPVARCIEHVFKADLEPIPAPPEVVVEFEKFVEVQTKRAM